VKRRSINRTPVAARINTQPISSSIWLVASFAGSPAAQRPTGRATPETSIARAIAARYLNLKSKDGDRNNTPLVAAGFNSHVILRRVGAPLGALLHAVFGIVTPVA
jgi:hypothetical protein